MCFGHLRLEHPIRHSDLTLLLFYSLNSSTNPNPPAFFAALRTYSLMSHRRATAFVALRTRLGRYVVDTEQAVVVAGKGKGRAGEGEDEGDDALDSRLVFSNPSFVTSALPRAKC